MAQVFVDMDGVLADFDRHYQDTFGVFPDKKLDHVDWEKVRNHEDFYLHIPPMPDMAELWSYVVKLNPIVLTGIPSSVAEAYANKRGWVTKHLGLLTPMIGCASRDKCVYASPGDVLIDDWEKYKDLWIGKGGRWITHTSAKSSIEQLKQLGF